MKLTEAQIALLRWMHAHPGGSVIIRGNRRKVAEALIFHNPKLIEVYEWMNGSLIGKLLDAGRRALQSQSQEGK